MADFFTDLYTAPVVVTGLAVTSGGTASNAVTVAPGTCYIPNSFNGPRQQTFLTSTVYVPNSSTVYINFNGISFQVASSSSVPAGYIQLASVVVNGSGTPTVTDLRSFAEVVPNETAATASFGATTITGKLTSANASVPAAPTAGANAGTSPPAPVLVAGSNDTTGSITFGTGTSPALGDMVDVVFGTAYAATPKSIQVIATNAATGLKIPCTVAKSTTGFSIGLAVAPAASQANTVYAVDYLVIA